jgi:hypothetical protein
VNFPGFLFGLMMAAAGGVGILLWARMQGTLGTQSEGTDMGFASPSPIVPGSPAEEEEFAFEGSIPLGSSIGHRLASLIAIVFFVAVVGTAVAIAFFLAGNLAIRSIEHFIQTSPSP